MTANVPRALSIELLLMVGLPVAVLIAGAVTLALAFGSGFTPLPQPASMAMHGS